jgi:hypothetical protein
MECAMCVATLDRFVAQMDPVTADIYAAPKMSAFLAAFLTNHAARVGSVMKDTFVARVTFVRLADMRVTVVVLAIHVASGMCAHHRDCATIVES